jgi:uncharacterized phiE125 gp8 family phage protein
MLLVELSSVPASALPIQGLADQLRLGTGFAEDGLQNELLEAYLRAALSAVEARCGRVLVQRLFSWELTGWRNAGRQVLPVRPVSAVTGLKTIDRVGTETVHTTDVYQFEADDTRPTVVAVGTSLPAIAQGGTAKIDFTAGYGTAWADVPDDLGRAVILLAAHFYEKRRGEAGESGGLPAMVLALLQPYRPVRLWGGM